MAQSYFEFGEDGARFHGNLDTETLGGAGFASQRTTGDDREWDLSDYAGIQLAIKKGDSMDCVALHDKVYQAEQAIEKRYTFILKDELLPPDEKTGREQSTISWE